VLPLTLPPLRERREDIPELMNAFLQRFFSRKGEPTPAITEGVQRAFIQYDWPGNVRELENACERVAQLCTCGTVGVGCVAAGIMFSASRQPAEAVAPAILPEGPATPISLDGRLRDLETSLITWALKASHGNKSRAAELLQIKRSTLGDRIKHCGLDRAAAGEPEPKGSDATAA
jgi:DNA-binding NtrC family response regulator